MLAHTVLTHNARTLEDLVSEMLRPMLKVWLDDNLPAMVERLVRAEIERCHDESIDYTTTAESVVGVFVEVLRNPPTLVTDVDGVTRVEPS